MESIETCIFCNSAAQLLPMHTKFLPCFLCELKVMPGNALISYLLIKSVLTSGAKIVVFFVSFGRSEDCFRLNFFYIVLFSSLVCDI